MKKKLLSLLIIGMLIVTNSELKADGGGEKRKNCYGFLRYRYKASANISSKVNNKSREVKDASCNGLSITAQILNCMSSNCPNNVLSQWGYSTQTSNSNGINHSFRGDTRYFNHGKFENDNIFSMKGIKAMATTSNVTAIADVVANIHWADENSPTNNNVNFNSFSTSIKLGLNDNTSRYTYELCIWKADDDYDSTITNEKILWSTGFVYKNNNLTRSGALSNGIVLYTLTDSTRVMTLNLSTLTSILINQSGSIRITGRFHKDDDYNASSTIMPENNNQGGILNEMGLNKVNVYQPNVKTLKLDLNFKNETEVKSNSLKISIYNIEGKIIKEIENLIIDEENKNLSVFADLNNLNLNTNLYFIKIDYDSKEMFYRMLLNSN